MKTATVSDLTENFAQVSAWIENGEPVEIVKAGKVFARLVPAGLSCNPAPPKIDFAKQIRESWGERLLSSAEVAAMREAELTKDQV
jgi:antitoxin (DNA-binding transcriptional repressor) of toxin-antitoxin stability system